MVKFEKIPHPWWHWFFTDIVSWSIHDIWQKHRCTICKTEYTIHSEIDEYKEVIVKDRGI